MTNTPDSGNKKKFPIISIFFLGFIISVFFEFYWINYYPYDYFMLFGIGIILCIFGYLTIDSLIDMINQNARQREAQNEVMIKASKAIYLTAKKIITVSQSSGSAGNAKNLQNLISDLTLANERLAREIESAASLQLLVEDADGNEATGEEENSGNETSGNETDGDAENSGNETTGSVENSGDETADDMVAENTTTTENNDKNEFTEEQIAKMFADL